MTDLPEDAEGEAAEHALGVTSAEMRALAEVRRAREPGFDRAVGAWEERLAPLADEIAPMEPRRRVWPRVAKSIGQRGGLHSVAFWRGATAASLALAAASVLLVVIPSPEPPPTEPASAPAPAPVLTGLIAPAAGAQGPMVVAMVDEARNELVFTAASVVTAADKSAELWVIPAGQTPQSLGVIAAGQERRMPLPAALTGAGQATAVLAITMEQAGGSPDGAPHGPVVATGGLKKA
jgi:anti-sigma-K factor RskA